MSLSIQYGSWPHGMTRMYRFFIFSSSLVLAGFVWLNLRDCPVFWSSPCPLATGVTARALISLSLARVAVRSISHTQEFLRAVPSNCVPEGILGIKILQYKLRPATSHVIGHHRRAREHLLVSAASLQKCAVQFGAATRAKGPYRLK